MHQATVAAQNQAAVAALDRRKPNPGAQIPTPSRNTRLARPAIAPLSRYAEVTSEPACRSALGRYLVKVPGTLSTATVDSRVIAEMVADPRPTSTAG